MGKVIWLEDFRRKKELSKINIAREIGTLNIETKESNPVSGRIECAKEKLRPNEVRDFFQKDLVKSGDNIIRLEKKLKDDFGVRNNELPKRKKVIDFFKRIMGLGSQSEEFYQKRNEQIREAQFLAHMDEMRREEQVKEAERKKGFLRQRLVQRQSTEEADGVDEAA